MMTKINMKFERLAANRIMRSLAFTTLLLTFTMSLCGYGQNTTDTSIIEPYLAPKFLASKGDLGATANLTGLINNISASPRLDSRGASSVIVRYVSSDLISLRFGLAPSIMSVRQLSTDSVGKDLVETDSSARQASISFRPAIEFHLKGTERLDPYILLEGEVGTIGQFRAGSNTSITDTTGVGTINRTITEDGGFNLGAHVGLGFNYFLVKRLALGMEYGLGVNYMITGGDRQEVIQSDPTSGVAKTTRVLSSSRSSMTNFGVDPMVQFTVSYFFDI